MDITMTDPKDTLGTGPLCARSVPDPYTADPCAAFDLARLFPSESASLRSYIEGIARSTQTPASMSALGAMCVASACVSRLMRIRGWGDHTEEAPIWGLILSEPGTRKSAVVGELLAPVARWERAMAPEHERLQREHQALVKRARALEDRAARTDDADERTGLLEQAERAHRDASDAPPLPAILSAEPTPEALLRLMHDNGGAALIASAEADVVDIVLGRYSGGQRNFGVLLKGHAGDALRSHRAGGSAYAIDRPRLAVCLVVQPASVRAMLADPQAKGRGLIARFAILAPEGNVGNRDVRPAPIDPRHRDCWHRTVTGLLNAPVPESPHEIELDPDADHVYLRFQRQVEIALSSGPLRDRREWGGKLCGLALRCALTLHAIANHPATPGGQLHPRHERVTAQTMHAGIAWARFLSRATEHATRRVEAGEANQEREALLRWIAERDGTTTLGSLMAGNRRYRRDGRGAQAACDALVDEGLARWEPTERGQRLVLQSQEEDAPRQPSAVSR